MAVAREAQDRAFAGGLVEGVARAVSQAGVYCIEAQKSMLQVSKAAPVVAPLRMLRTMTESAVASGVVFGMYFATYNGIGMANPLAGPVATLVTSCIKIPIGNAMRCVHVGLAGGIVGGTKRIVRLQGPRGLYSGYALSVVEDMIEFDMRTRLYVHMRGTMPDDNLACGVGVGALAGMVASLVTTPFDTIRANMIVHRKNAVTATRDLFRIGGITELYKGAGYRVMSNGVKYALFFMVFEMLTRTARPSCA